jgi:hypothetical protein
LKSRHLLNIPEGWTDDITIVVPTGRSLDDVVDYVLQSTIRGVSPTKMVEQLSVEFGLTQSDAELALDRTYGGGVRAGTGQKATVHQVTRTQWRGPVSRSV